MQELLERTMQQIKEVTESAPKILLDKKVFLQSSEDIINRCANGLQTETERENFKKFAKELEKKLSYLLFLKQDGGYISYNDLTTVMAALMNSCPTSDNLEEVSSNMAYAVIYTSEMTAKWAYLPPSYRQKVEEIQNKCFKELEKFEKQDT